MSTTLMTMLCLCKSDDDAPSASAGDRVNRECYMQVRERGCTTPALVRFSVAGF